MTMQTLSDAIAFMERIRKRKTFRLDPLVLEALALMAKADGRSVNALAERLLYRACKDAGYIAEGEELLGETRGGDRTGLGDDEDDDDV